MPLFEYVCTNGHRSELLRPRDVEVEFCVCGETASRATVYRVNHTGFASTPMGQTDFSKDYKRFEEASATMDYNASKVEKADGTTVKLPNYYKAAKELAPKMLAEGVTADRIST